MPGAGRRLGPFPACFPCTNFSGKIKSSLIHTILCYCKFKLSAKLCKMNRSWTIFWLASIFSKTIRIKLSAILLMRNFVEIVQLGENLRLIKRILGSEFFFFPKRWLSCGLLGSKCCISIKFSGIPGSYYGSWGICWLFIVCVLVAIFSLKTPFQWYFPWEQSVVDEGIVNAFMDIKSYCALPLNAH